MANIKLQTRNVDSLQDNNKRKKLFQLLKNSDENLFFLQETHTTPKCEAIWKKEWEGDIVFAHGSSKSRGVAILIKTSLQVKINKAIKDCEGRYVILDTTILNKNIAIINIYGPNEDSPNFFIKIIEQIENIDPITHILGGDWNITLNPSLDRFGNSKDYNAKSRQVLLSWMDENKLIDIWRKKNPTTRRYTLIRKKPHPHGSRLDYFLISESLYNNTIKTSIGPKILSDHAPANLNIKMADNPRGNGYFKLNTSHLQKPSYVELINITIDKAVSDHQNTLDSQQLWEFVKYKVREKSIEFGKREKKKTKTTKLQHYTTKFQF